MKIDVMGSTMHYETAGEGLPLLAIHGWGVDHRIMEGCLEPAFAKAPFACERFYPDLPGMGLSPGSDAIAGSDDMLDRVEAFIEALFPGKDFLLAGLSYGGYLARGLLRKMPGRIKGLFLICPSFKPWVRVEERIIRGEVPDHRVVEEDAEFMRSLSEGERADFRAMGVSLTPKAWELYSRYVLPGVRAADADFLENKLSRKVPFETDPDLLERPFEEPSLIITGRQDSSAGYRGIWSILENFPRASFAVLDGGGHNMHTERPELFRALVEDWIDRLASSLRT